ncbi:MAG: reactive intermediate/imine deaminase [Luteitalea sp.]|nr:reactive intermediate/imine deaminase [Luteitalea sp.]
MPSRTAISTTDAPPAMGPYSQAIRAGGFLFASGQIAFDPSTGQVIEGDIRAQTARVLENLGAVLRAAGVSYDAVVKTSVFLADLDDFVAMNEVYARYFPTPLPARTTIQAGRLPRNLRVEIDVIAILGT